MNSTQPKENVLRKLLIESLDNPEIDYGRLLELANKLAQLDPDHVRFTVDASHISRLGRELVVKKETAVSELVKNAFDADATHATLTFMDAEQSGGVLLIEDDGQGMTRKQLVDGFMRLSTTEKVHQPLSPKYGRLRAGRKGIGRFAAQRLGRKLTITTQTKNMDVALRVRIDWSQFGADQELFLISNRVEEVQKVCEHGSILKIEDLEDGWTGDAITRVYRFLADLLQPFPISRLKKANIKDPGFDPRIYRSISGKKEEIASVEKLIYEYALAEIDGSVDEKGKGSWSIQSKYLRLKEKKIPFHRGDGHIPFGNLRNVHLKAYYYIFTENIPRHQKTLIQELARERGGIRVYRNGFRVLPFGEPDDDWLNLDAVSARRKILPPFQNENFFGFVEIIDMLGTYFEETSSREGLLNNQSFQELVEFSYGVLQAAVFRIAEVRKKKQKPTKRDIPAEKRLKKAVQEIQHVLKETIQTDPGAIKEDQQKMIREAVQTINLVISEHAEERALLLEEVAMLRVLASLGLVIGEFTHEIRQMFSALTADVNQILEIHPRGPVKEIAQRLLLNVRSFRTYTSFFDRAVAANARRETVPQELGKALRTFWEITQPTSNRYGIDIPAPDILDYDLFTIPMHPSEWISILFNLYTNSYKAIRRSGHSANGGRILMRAGRDGKNVFIEFADNGDGIPPENQGRIFDAFFTTSMVPSKEEDDQDYLIGTGLGLKIIKDIVTAYRGDIYISGAPRDYVTCFRIEIPAASEKEIETYGY